MPADTLGHVEPLRPGDPAPPIPGADLDGDEPVAVVFYKVTCPTCRLAAPVADRLAEAQGERFVAVAQDPPEAVRDFAERHGVGFPSISDAPPYDVSNAYGIRTVPTVFTVERGAVTDVVESWDRAGWNRLGEALGVGELSHASDGLPPFRPG